MSGLSSKIDRSASSIPSSWKSVKLDNICSLVRDKVDPAEFLNVPYVGLEHLASGDPTLANWGDSTEVRSSKGLFNSGDVLYGRLRPYLDKAVVAPFPGICSTDILILRPKDGVVLPEVLVSILHTSTFLQHAVNTTTGTNLPRTRWSSIRQFEFRLPHLPEQRGIVRVLNTVRKAIDSTNAVIAASNQLKRSLIDYLFTYGPTPPDKSVAVEVTTTQFGSHPTTWTNARLGDLGTLDDGDWILKEFYAPSGVRLIQIADIGEGSFLDKSDRFISEKSAEELGCTFLTSGQILISRMASPVGRACIFPDIGGKAITAVDVAILTPNHDVIDQDFLLCFLNSHFNYEQCEMLAGGVTRKRISRSNLEKVFVPLPPQHEQVRIGATLGRLDKKIDAAINRRMILEELYRSLLQGLLMGRVRTKE